MSDELAAIREPRMVITVMACGCDGDHTAYCAEGWGPRSDVVARESSDELAAIRERHDRVAVKDKWSTPRMAFIDLQETHADRGDLLALLDGECARRALADARVRALGEALDRTARTLDATLWTEVDEQAIRDVVRDARALVDTLA